MNAFTCVWLLFSALMGAEGHAVPEAMVTAPALLPRAESVFGYYSLTTEGDATICRIPPSVLRNLPKTHIHV